MASLISPLTSGAIEHALSTLINSTSGAGAAGNAEEPRSALVFTSRYRQKLIADVTERLDAANAAVRTLNSSSSNAGQSIFGTDVDDLNGQLDRAFPSVIMSVNPHNIEFDQPKRYSRQDTLKGTVFHHFTNDKGQNNDLLTIRFQGSTGNISRQGRTSEDRHRGIHRLQIWHNLYQLTREPMLLSDGAPNVFTISYVSALFPVQIDFRGFFTKVLTFSESGSKPNSRDYSMEFIVQETSPDLDTMITNILDFVVQQAVATPNQESRILSATNG